MCGLAGVLLAPIERSAEGWESVRRLFVQTLVSNEERGREASGVARVQRDGNFSLFKQPVPVSELIEMRPFQDIMNSIGPETVCLLGHTRLPTKGSRWNNENNHPLVAAHTLGIHNGTIHNDDVLFATQNLRRRGEVDSEIIYRMLDAVDPTSLNDRYLPTVVEKTSLLDGRLTSLSVDLRRPTQLLVLKRDNPLCLHYEPSLQALFFSSRYLSLRQLFGRVVAKEELENGAAYIFDAQCLSGYRKLPLSTPEGLGSTERGSHPTL